MKRRLIHRSSNLLGRFSVGKRLGCNFTPMELSNPYLQLISLDIPAFYPLLCFRPQGLGVSPSYAHLSAYLSPPAVRFNGSAFGVRVPKRC